MGGTGVSKSQVSRLCEEIDERVNAFLARPLEGEWRNVWLDATYVKVRRNNRIVSVAVILLEQNDEWAIQRARCMTLENIATLSDDAVVRLPAVAI